MKTVAIMVGSLRQGSWNKKLAHAVEKVAGARWTCRYADLASVPLYNEDLWPTPPAAVPALKQLIETSDGLVIVTPEYNRSLPGVLKNAIDWATRPGGKSSFKGKPTAILGASAGQLGTAIAQSHLRSILAPIGALALTGPEVYVTGKDGLFADDHTINDERVRGSVEKLVDAFDGWMARLAG